jgi:hypothetical protein
VGWHSSRYSREEVSCVASAENKVGRGLLTPLHHDGTILQTTSELADISCRILLRNNQSLSCRANIHHTTFPSRVFDIKGCYSYSIYNRCSVRTQVVWRRRLETISTTFSVTPKGRKSWIVCVSTCSPIRCITGCWF